MEEENFPHTLTESVGAMCSMTEYPSIRGVENKWGIGFREGFGRILCIFKV